MRSKLEATAILAIVVLLAAVSSRAQQWTLLLPDFPSQGQVTRDGHSAVYDPATNRMIAFGGATESQLLNDVIVLTNANGVGDGQWINLAPSGAPPPRRASHIGVYDSNTNRMTVFGGCGATICTSALLNDVWVLANANGIGGSPAWTQLSPTGGPPAARAAHTAVYDPSSNRMIVFGGSTFGGITFSDVWVLTNANGLGGSPTWIQLSPSGGPPTGQSDSRAVYDVANNVLIVFAGYRSDDSTITNAVWALSNANGLGGTSLWNNLVPEAAPGSPPQRASHSAVYDRATNSMIIYGGQGAEIHPPLDDAWVLSNANGLGGIPEWTQLAPDGVLPVARIFHTAVFDAANRRMTVFGGGSFEGLFFSTWVLTGATRASPIGASGANSALSSQIDSFPRFRRGRLITVNMLRLVRCTQCFHWSGPHHGDSVGVRQLGGIESPEVLRQEPAPPIRPRHSRFDG